MIQRIPGVRDTAAENMLKDIEMFNSCEVPTFRIYGWSKPSITVGYSQNMEEEIDLQKAAAAGIEVIKRPTGGGIVFHNENDVTYCVASPLSAIPGSLMDSYYLISKILLNALNDMGIDASIKARTTDDQTPDPSPFSSICFTSPREYEISVDGKKLVGSAQKRTRDRMIQQGTVSVARTPEIFFDLLKNKTDQAQYYSSTVSIEELCPDLASFEKIRQSLVSRFLLLSERKTLAAA